MSAIETKPTDDVALLRFKYRRRELAVRRVALVLRALGLVGLLWSVMRIAALIAANVAAVGGDRTLVGVWEGARGLFHQRVMEELRVVLPIAMLLGAAGLGLDRFRNWARPLSAVTALLLAAVAMVAIAIALTQHPIDDWELTNFPSPFFLGLIALGFVLPFSAMLFGFVRSRLLDPIFTEDYRRAIRSTPPIAWPTWLIRLMALVIVLLAVYWGVGHVRNVLATEPESWGVPSVMVPNWPE